MRCQRNRDTKGRTLLVLAVLLISVFSTLAQADHFYTTSSSGELAKQARYKFEGIAAYVYPTQLGSSVPMYRWFNPTSGDHFYTTAAGERPANYNQEGIAFYCLPTQQEGAIAFYRWFDPGSRYHFYTTDPGGEYAPRLGYTSEGIACYVFGSQVKDTVRLFRWYQGPVGGSGKPQGTQQQQCKLVCDADMENCVLVCQ
jgi:hypothetical protein